ncbi:MAG TPA: transaldolase family protein, partial [Acidimicrobiia bacterium]
MSARTSPICRLVEYGQSPWYDNLRRKLITNGDLAGLREEDCIRGVTSNPTIFEKAVSAGEEYDAAVAELARQGMSTDDIGWTLVTEDVAAACEVLRPAFEETGGGDGFV